MLALRWCAEDPDVRYRSLEGTLVFADISGFTRLTERLAAKGRFGAEEMSDHLDQVLSVLLGAAASYGGWLVKWGGDALLLMFDGDGHAERACAASATMRTQMADVGRLDTSVGRVRLRMSVGVHTGTFEFVLVGRHHRELLVTGDAATVTANLEVDAEAGEIVVSPATAALLPARCRGGPKGGGILLAAAPAAPRLDPPAVPVLDPAQVRAVLPVMVAEHLAAGGGSGEHRQVAVAFVEFRGIGEIRRSRGPAGVVTALEHLVDITQDACHRYGVSFHETDIGPDGGKFMLVAGAPRALDDPCEAMLCVARAAVDNPGALTVRVGVTTGRVFTGAVGPPYRRSYSAKGDIVNLAARVMGKTAPGSVWAIPAVVDNSRTQFASAEVPPFAVKGKKQPVHAYDVGSPLSRTRTDAQLPFVGRIAQLASLWVGVVHAKAGAGSVHELVGEAGSGKTRMLAELTSLANGFGVLHVGAEPHRTATAYAVAADLLQQALGLGVAEPSVVATRLAAWSDAVAPDLRPWLPLLGNVLDVPVPETAATRDLDERFRRPRTEEVFVEALTAALTRPTAILVDDAQFADEASLGALSKAAVAAADRPWLVVIARRPVGDWTLSGTDPQARLDLAPLPEDEARMLVAAETARAPLSAHAMNAVLERGDGNPMFLRALARAASDAGGPGDTLPDSIENLLVTQIDSLAPARRDLLRAASVIGMSVDPQLLRAVLDVDEQRLGEDLEQLQGFLSPDGHGYRFRQALIRDAAYESLPFRRRAVLHGRVAEELTRSDDAGDIASVLSLHYFQAGRFSEAADAAIHAATRSAAAYANVEAETLVLRAITALRRTAARSDNLPALYEQLGDIRFRLGDFDGADAAYSNARRLLSDEPVAAARLGLKTARNPVEQGDYRKTVERLRRARKLLVGVDGPQARRLRLDADLRAASTQFRRGAFAAARSTCLDILARIDRPEPEPGVIDVLAETLTLLDVADLGLGRPAGTNRAERALLLFEQVGDLNDQARLLNHIGYRAYFDGRWTDAVDCYSRARDLYARIGDSSNVAVQDANLAEILVHQGRLAEAETALRSALQIWRAAGAWNFVAFACSLLGRVLARQGDGDAARATLAEARAMFVDQGARTEVVDADAYTAECLMLEGRLAEALALARATLAEARSLSELPEQAPLLHRIVGAGLDASGDHKRATAAYDEALAVARQRSADHEIAFTLAAMAARASTAGVDVDPGWSTEAASLGQRLGLVIDLTSSRRAQQVVRLPVQRAGVLPGARPTASGRRSPTG